MSAAELKKLKEKVKKYIDEADENAVKMVYTVLEETEWWDSIPENIKADIEESIAQADRGDVMTHAEVKKKYPQWFTK